MHTHTKHISKLAILFCFLLLPFFVVFAQETTYSPLINIPGLSTEGGAASIPDFINTVYKIVIGLGALLGVIKIAIAGVKYSTSGVVTDKSSARDDIKGVLLGLAVLLVPWIVLTTIHPNLVKLNFADDISGTGLSKNITERDVLYTKTCDPEVEDNKLFGSDCGNDFLEACRQSAAISPWVEIDDVYVESSTDANGVVTCTAFTHKIVGSVTAKDDERVARYLCSQDDKSKCLTECKKKLKERSDFGEFTSGPEVKDGTCYAVYKIKEDG